MATAASSIGALVFTVPLTAHYFNTFTLISPLSNLLCVAAAGWNFMAGFVTVLLGFIWLPAAKIVGGLSFCLTHYVLWMSRKLMTLPWHALYFSNRLLKYWLVYAYAVFAVCYFVPGRKRRYAVGAGLVSAMLALTVFLNTRLGLAIRPTGDNPDMVRSSSINPVFTTTVGLCVANAFTGLSGCLLAQSQKSVSIDIGTGMVTVALASLLIGQVLMGRGSILKRAIGMVVGAFAFRLVYTIALRLNMPAFMLKLVSSVIVILAIATPYLKRQMPVLRRRVAARK